MKYLFVLILLLHSCQPKTNIEHGYIRDLAQESQGLPMRYGNLFVFIQIDKEQVVFLRNAELNKIYKSLYKDKYQNYISFLDKLLATEIMINRRDLKDRLYTAFRLNNEVENDFNRTKFEEFESKYTYKNASGEMRIKDRYNQSVYSYSILYYLFRKNFKIAFDDHIGSFRIS